MNLNKQSKHQLRVGLFMAKMKSDKQATPPIPTEPPKDIRVLRAKLMAEECMETIQDGLGVSVRVAAPVITSNVINQLASLTLEVSKIGNPELQQALNSVLNAVEEAKGGLRDLNYDDLFFEADKQFNMIETADGLADCSVVNKGTAIACGIGMKPIQEIVDENNMAKFGPGHSFNEAGKLIQPKDHMPPTDEINRELRRQGWSGPTMQLKVPSVGTRFDTATIYDHSKNIAEMKG